MKRFIGSTVVLGLLALFSVPVAAAEWQVDRVHSHIGFTVRHMVVSKVPGEFTDFEGTLDFDGENFEKATVSFTIQAASITTNNEKRDAHLKSDDFFAVEKYPTLSFVSKKVIPGENGHFQVVGDFTMRGVTKEVTFECEFNGVIKDPYGNTRAGFSAETEINRQEFGVSWSKSMDAGGLVVSDNVAIAIEVEAVQAQ
jgi:polyisoprenoid-binding protein YceI